MTIKLTKNQARDIWINAQRLDVRNPFGNGTKAVSKAVHHLGYVQIDTINVIERCHHHILYNRIPNYKRIHLHQAQTQEKSIFEYWTHALAYISTHDYKYFIHQMKKFEELPGIWFSTVSEDEMKKVTKLLKKGALSIRDIKDDVLVEKQHEWASKKPSKKALQMGFYSGKFVVSEREGMLKKYDLADRHFAWTKKPKAVTESQYTEYTIDRALKSQGVISLDSVCHLNPKSKPQTLKHIEKRVKNSELLEVQIAGHEKFQHWLIPHILDAKISTSKLTHILSPFDPLIIQRKRLKMFFDYDHIFEAYVPKHKRKFGYFTLPVLSENKIIAMLDLKTDRAEKRLLIQNWVWIDRYKSVQNKTKIELELERFERFQLDI